MSARKATCPACRERVAACVCDDDGLLDDLPLDCGPLIRSMMGGDDPEPGDGPPYTHVHRFPVPEVDEDGEEVGPYVPPPAPIVVVKATKRGACRHCRTPVTYGPKGWRDDEGGLLAYGCIEAPLGFHQP